LISQEIGYTERGRRGFAGAREEPRIKIPEPLAVKTAFQRLGLSYNHLFDERDQSTKLWRAATDYFEHRANVLQKFVEPALMDAEEARRVFEEVKRTYSNSAPSPMNKQSGDKKRPAYLTGIVNTLLAEHLGDSPCDFDPRQLTVVTREGAPFRTLSRRIDGAFPGPVDPVAVWEIKEYYHTTTFGSRVADGVYETLLDGWELNESASAAAVLGAAKPVRHLLIVDARYTWWVMGRSYLCRIVDMLHMGFVDEVLFGREVVSRLPVIASEWKQAWTRRTAEARGGVSPAVRTGRASRRKGGKPG
jgi:hypothetical protein